MVFPLNIHITLIYDALPLIQLFQHFLSIFRLIKQFYYFFWTRKSGAALGFQVDARDHPAFDCHVLCANGL